MEETSARFRQGWTQRFDACKNNSMLQNMCAVKGSKCKPKRDSRVTWCRQNRRKRGSSTSGFDERICRPGGAFEREGREKMERRERGLNRSRRNRLLRPKSLGFLPGRKSLRAVIAARG
jgi:hypothetical protein